MGRGVRKKRQNVGPKKPSYVVGQEVHAVDTALGPSAWRPATVVGVFREDSEWLIRVRFEGGRQSILRAPGVRSA